jgi:hypothetical protein
VFLPYGLFTQIRHGAPAQDQRRNLCRFATIDWLTGLIEQFRMHGDSARGKTLDSVRLHHGHHGGDSVPPFGLGGPCLNQPVLTYVPDPSPFLSSVHLAGVGDHAVAKWLLLEPH